MLPSMDSLNELEAFQANCDWWVFWGTIVVGLLVAVLGPAISSYRTKVETRITELKSQAAAQEERERADNLARQLAEQLPRRLTDAQRQRLIAAISKYPKQKVEVKCLTWDTEASRYAQDFVEVFRAAGWECGPILNSTFPLDFENVTLGVREGTPREECQAAIDLLVTLDDLDLVRSSAILPYFSDYAKDQIDFRIGAKTSIPLKATKTE